MGSAVEMASTEKNSDNGQEVLDFRVRHLRELLEPYYEHTFSAEESLAIFPKWPDGFADGEKEKQEMVSACVKRVLEFAVRPSIDASRFQLHRCEETAASSQPYVVPPGSLYFDLGLDTSVMNFRLLELLPPVGDGIECVLKVSGEPESASYDALSYVWGAPTPTKSIIVNGVERLVGPNLYSALKTLQTPTKRCLWVDALCIDQMNDEEKGWQVAMMAEIYHHADKVLIHLGDEDVDTAALFAFLNRTHDLDNESSIGDIAGRCGIDIQDLLTSYYKFTLRPWFTRIWVCQEFSAAKILPTWICGPYTASTGSLQRDLQMLFARCVESQVLWTADNVGDLDLAQKASFDEFVSPLIEAARILFQPGGGYFHSFPCIMYLQIKRDCTDPRDVVYGLRGMFEPAFRDAFYPDYTITLDELFARLSSWFLILDHWGDVFFSYPRRMSSSLPSWVRDFSQRPVELPTPWSDNRHIGIPMLSAIRDGVWYVEGVILEQISETFNIDEDDELATYSRLWHLDQFFTKPDRAVANQESLLSPLKTNHSLSHWAMDHSGEESTVITHMPLIRSALNIPQEIAAPRFAFFDQKLQDCEPLPEKELAHLSPHDAMTLNERRSEEHSQWTDRVCNLTDLISHVIGSACGREDIIGASLFDYHNLRERLLAFRGSVSGREEDLPSGDLPPTNTFLPLAYSKTLDFLAEKGDAELIEVLLEIVETIHKSGLDTSSAKFPDRTDKDIKIAEKSVEKYKQSIEEFVSDVEEWKDTPVDTGGAETVLAEANHTLSKSKATVETLHNSRTSMQRLQSAPKHMIERVMNSTARRFQHSSFFVTEGGLPGVGTPGVRGFRVGDTLAWLDDMLFPLVLREAVGGEEGLWEVIGTVKVSGIMAGRMRSLLGDKFPQNRQFKIV